MFVCDDSIINYRERKYKSNKKEIKDCKRKSENNDYINVKGRYYTSNPWLITRNRTPPPHFVDGKITSKTIGKTILPTSCQNYAARCVTKTIGKIIWLREMLMLKSKVKVVPSKILIQAKQK